MSRPFRLACLVLCAQGLGACDHGSSQAAASDAGSSADTSEAGADAAAPSEGGEDAVSPAPSPAADAGEDGGTALAPNESFETARPVDGNSALVDIFHAEQRNYFTLDVAAGDTYEIYTAINDYSPDVVLSIYDRDRKLVARNDDGSLWPGDAVDARLVTRFPEAGRFFLELYDPSTPPEFFEQSSFTLDYYVLHVVKVGTDTPGFASPGDTGAPRYITDSDTGYRYLTLVGDLRGADAVSSVLESEGDNALIAHVHGSGSEANGSRCTPKAVRVETAAGQLVAQTRGGIASVPLYPPLRAGRHTLTAQGSAGCVGGFFAVDLVLLPDNPREASEPTNGALGGAEPVTTKGLTVHRGLLLADVPPGDVDYFSFDTVAGGFVTTSCEGESAGSGIRGLVVELRDATDALLATAARRADGPLDVTGFPVTSTGKMALRLTSTGSSDPDGAEPWVRCVVLTTP